MPLPAPTLNESNHPSRLLPAVGFVLTGLAGRALIDKLLALRGGTELVAHWAQVGNLADIVAGVSLAGIGIGLTGRVAGVAPSHQRKLLGEALRLGLALSTLCLMVCVGLTSSGRLALLGATHVSLLIPALAVGWLAVAPGLCVAWLLGRGQPGRAMLLVTIALTLSCTALSLAAAGDELAALLAAQAVFGAGVTLWLLAGEGSWRDALSRGHKLRPFVAAGFAIGILSPAATGCACCPGSSCLVCLRAGRDGR